MLACLSPNGGRFARGSRQSSGEEIHPEGRGHYRRVHPSVSEPKFGAQRGESLSSLVLTWLPGHLLEAHREQRVCACVRMCAHVRACVRMRVGARAPLECVL